MHVHEHYCNQCKQHYECTHSACKFVFIRMCISCKLLDDELDQLIEDRDRE